MICLALWSVLLPVPASPGPWKHGPRTAQICEVDAHTCPYSTNSALVSVATDPLRKSWAGGLSEPRSSRHKSSKFQFLLKNLNFISCSPWSNKPDLNTWSWSVSYSWKENVPGKTVSKAAHTSDSPALLLRERGTWGLRCTTSFWALKQQLSGVKANKTSNLSASSRTFFHELRGPQSTC